MPLLLIKGLPETYLVATGSMEPAIKTGSMIFTRKPVFDHLQKGDIITFRNPDNAGQIITHRIEKITDDDPVIIKTKGDNNQEADLWQLTADDVAGVYLFSLPFVGRVSQFIRQPRGFFVLIVLPACFIVIKHLFNIKKAIDEEIKRKINGKQSNLKLTIFFLFLTSFLSLVSFTGIALALFSDQAKVSGLQLSTGDWIPPDSAVTGQLDLEITNDNQLNINYQASDQGAGVDYIELWYSYNQNNWQLFGSDGNGLSGSFLFDCPQGDGFYDFQTLAVDKKGNEEEKDFESGYRSVFIDTTPPASQLSDDYWITSEDEFGSGVFKINYSVNEGQWKTIYGSKQFIKNEIPSGESSVKFFAEDSAGNIESENVIDIIN